MAVGDRRRFRILELDLDLEAVENEEGEFEVTDDAGAKWTRFSYLSGDGRVADTFGPGRKDVPTIVKHLRGLKP